MKKVFVCLLAIILMGLMTFNTAAAEAVADLTRYDTASLNDFPELVTDKTVSEHRLLERRKDDEGRSLNTLAYRKEDGQNVAFVYPYDVKYTDKNGKIKDKSREIVKDGLFTSTSFKTKDNDILSYFSINDDGNVEVITTYGDYSITSVIENRNQSNKITASNKDGKLIYTNAVDSGIHLMYEPQYNGVKEYVVLDANLNHEFEFTMDFVGLTPMLIENNGGVSLINAEGEEILSIPPIYVEDAAGQGTYENAVSLQQVDGDTYVMKITVDQAFLEDEGTVYPVYVDPHITRRNSYITDTFVREDSPNVSYADSTSNLVGKNGTKRIYSYVKFDISSLSSAISNSYYNILSAYYETYEVSNTNDTVLIEVLPVLSSWTESSLTWNSQPSYDNEIIGKAQVGRNSAPIDPDFGTRGLYRIYISNLVRGWVQGLPNYGMLLRTSYNTGTVELASSESTKLVKLVVVYAMNADYPLEEDLSVPDESNYFYIKNRKSGLYLTAGSTTATSNVYQSTYEGSITQKWKLVPKENGYYQIQLYNSKYVLDVYCGGGENTPSGNTNNANIQSYPRGSGDNQKWKLTRNWNGTYKILSALSNDTKGLTVLNASITNGANCILYTHNVNYSYNDDWTLEPVTLNNAYFYGFSNTDGSNKGVSSQEQCDDAQLLANDMNFYNVYSRIDVSASQALEEISNSNLWYFLNGHGVRPGSAVKFVSFDATNNVWVPSYLYASSFASLQSNLLRNTYLVGFNCCHAGDSSDENGSKTDLVGMIYRKGAHFVFASPPVTHEGPNNDWMISFMTQLKEGATYYQAIQTADSTVITNANQGDYSLFEAMKSCSRHYAGDSSIILYHNPSS